MSPYEIAWLVVIIAAVLGTLGLVFLTRKVGPAWLKNLLRWLPLLLLIVPAGIPGYEGEYAPAFVVAVFEALFQTNGNPLPALRILLLTLVAGAVTILLLARFLPSATRVRTPAE